MADGSRSIARLRSAGLEVARSNPERGFYRDVDSLTANPAELRKELEGVYASGDRLVLTHVRLDRFRGAPIPQATLQAIEAGLGEVRRAGLKAVVRASYNQPQGETGYSGAPDAPGERVLEHIAQLAPVLQRNRDTIAFTQAGFIGAWGEWHSSSNGLTSPQWRARIGEALLANLPGPVQFRYPRDVERHAAGDRTGRVGVHNDCFMSSPTDVGTYAEDPGERGRQRAAIANRSAAAPFGGETCNPDDDREPVPRLSCDAVRDEGPRFHVTYLNRSYNTAFHESWKRNGCFPEVESRMGYRMRIDQIEAPAQLTPGAEATIGLRVANDGWARMYNQRDAVAHLHNPATGERRTLPLTLDVGMRDWLPGRLTNAQARVRVPADLGVGRWNLAIGFPDTSPRLARDARFSVRPANSDDTQRGQFWDQAHGVFFTGHAFEVRR